MMQKNNLISVIVTAYNRKKFLPYALKSLESQTLPKDKFEVIVVKNFEDQISDDIIKKNGWKDMVTNVIPPWRHDSNRS
jgi:Glycosyl transferase family 2.